MLSMIWCNLVAFFVLSFERSKLGSCNIFSKRLVSVLLMFVTWVCRAT